jgi:hypothetical protein
MNIDMFTMRKVVHPATFMGASLALKSTLIAFQIYSWMMFGNRLERFAQGFRQGFKFKQKKSPE